MSTASGMPTREQERFKLEIIEHPGRGYDAILKSNRRGVFINDSQTFVNASGYRDLEIVGRLVGDLVWHFGSRDGRYQGLAACSSHAVEDISQLVAFRPWVWHDDDELMPSISYAYGTYLLRPSGRLDLGDLTGGDLLDKTHFFPRFPDTSLALKVEDGSTMFFVHDLSMDSMQYLIEICNEVCLPVSISEPFGDNLESMRTMDKMIEIVVNAASSFEVSRRENFPLSVWFSLWLGRFEKN